MNKVIASGGTAGAEMTEIVELNNEIQFLEKELE